MPKFSTFNKGTYVAVKFSEKTLDMIQDLQKELRLLDPVPRDKLHSTICYSRKFVNYKPETNRKLIGYTKALDVFEHNGKRALVLLLDSDYLHSRHEYANALGATYDFPDYKPHVTLSYDLGAQSIDYTNFDVGGNQLEMAHEYVEDLDLGWSDKK